MTYVTAAPAKSFILHTLLCFLDFKAFLYSFCEPINQKLGQPQPFDPNIYDLGIKWQRQLQKLLPSLPVIFFGSAKYRIPGDRDIDLAIVCPSHDFAYYVPALRRLLGQPTHQKRKYLTWTKKIGHQNTVMDVCLVDPHSSLYRQSVKPSIIVTQNPSLMEEYQRLKEDYIGKSLRSYEYARSRFSNRVILLNDPSLNLFNEMLSILEGLSP